LSPNGKKIAYVSYDGHDDEIYTINASGGKPVQVTYDNSDVWGPAWDVVRSGPSENRCLLKERDGAAIRPGPSSCPYSAECVEGKFCELRLL
jgi:hypothetical protein